MWRRVSAFLAWLSLSLALVIPRASTPRLPARLRFYVYTSPDLDWSFLRDCDGFSSLVDTAFAGEGMQEVHAYDVLLAHPYRTHNASEAALFYVPIWEFTSHRLHLCGALMTPYADAHAQRAQHAADALRASWSTQPSVASKPFQLGSSIHQQWAHAPSMWVTRPISMRSAPIAKGVQTGRGQLRYTTLADLTCAAPVWRCAAQSDGCYRTHQTEW